MLIKGKESKQSANSRYKKVTLIFLCGLIGIFLLSKSFSSGSERAFYCDAERISGEKFRSGGHSFMNGKTQSTDRAYNGKHSSKCDATNMYGMGYAFDNVRSGDVFEASIWRESKQGWGVLAVQGDWGFYDNAIEADQTDGDWERIKITVKIPFGVEHGTLKIFPYNNRKEGAVYFDDLKIRYSRSSADAPKSVGEYPGSTVNLQVDEQDVEKLRKKRGEAYKKGNLIASKKDLVAAKLSDGDLEVPVQIRLKGDLLDHLEGKKWSFRVIPDKGHSWKGMKEFSVHNSLSRSHVNEWALHQIFEREGIISSAYDFIQLDFNEDVLGIYAYEQHFNFLILERGQRPKGPIIRISEEGHWIQAPKGLKERPAWYDSAQIESFDRKEVLNDPILNEQFLQGQQLLYEFMNGRKKPSDVFDLHLFAKYFAILDLTQSWHSCNFTNLRFYYNPITGKLEPIGYDGYTDEGTKYHKLPTIFGAAYNSRTPRRHRFNDTRMMYYFLFNDLEFASTYISYVEKFTSKVYVDELVKTYYEDFKSREKFIQREYGDYKFDWIYYFRNAPEIQKTIYPLEHVSLKAYRQSKENGLSQIVLEGFHLLPLEILGFGNQAMEYPLKEPMIVEAFNKDVPVKQFFASSRGQVKTVFFRTMGTDSIFKAPVFEWPSPVAKPPAVNASLATLKGFNFLQINGTNVRFLPGTHRISQSLYIPADCQLEIRSNTNLVLESGVSIISYSPIMIQGTADRPVRIEGGGGIAVIRTEERSLIRHVVFDGLNSIRENSRYLAGGLNFYEAPADIESSVFLNSKAEDALSIIRSDCRVLNCRFSNCSGDGLDADYSKLEARGLLFETIGGDGLEISSGRADLDDIVIKNSLNAGLNANRGAVILLNKIEVRDCEIGLISKDQADLTIENAQLNKVKTGFKVFQENDAYVHAKMTVKTYSSEGVTDLYKRDAQSSLFLKGKEIQD